MVLFSIILYGVLGLVIGSFLNVVIFRVPHGESIVSPASHCPTCGHYLRPWELIPVLSFLALKGRCSKCGIKISWRYPLVELLTGILFVAVYLLRSDRTTLGIILDLSFLSLLIALTFIDVDTFRLPDILVSLTAGTGLASALVTGNPGIWQSLGGGLAAGSLFFFIAYFYADGMGWGDVKFVAALGLYLGFPGIFMAVFIASILGVIVGTLRILCLKKSWKDPIPFGPFLAGGAVIMLLWGRQLAELYGNFY